MSESTVNWHSLLIESLFGKVSFMFSGAQVGEDVSEVSVEVIILFVWIVLTVHIHLAPLLQCQGNAVIYICGSIHSFFSLVNRNVMRMT